MSEPALKISSEPAFCSGFGQYHTIKGGKPYLPVTLDEIAGMMYLPACVDKTNAQWVIFSDLHSRVKVDQIEHGRFYALWADIDDNRENQKTTEELFKIVGTITNDANRFVYTSRSATEDNIKARIIIPLAETVSGTDFEIYQEILNDKLAKLGVVPDRATETANQICYLPNKGDYYDAHYSNDSSSLNVTYWADDYQEKLAQLEQEEKERQQRRAKGEEKLKQRMESGCVSPKDAFNAAFPIELMLDTFGYIRRGKRWLSPNSESGVPGVTLRDNGLKWQSMHGSDAGIGEACKSGSGRFGDAFDLLVYYEHGGDFDAALKAVGEQFQINGRSLTKHNQIAYMENQSKQEAINGFEFIEPCNDNEDKSSRSVFVDIRKLESCAPDWLIDGHIEKNTLNCLFGDPGAGKSFVAIDMALCVANGEEWAGLGTQKGGVIYISGEGHNGIKRRIDAWEKQHKIETPENRFNLSTCPVLLSDPDAAAMVGEEINRIVKDSGHTPSLIVVDTLARNMGGDENSTKDMNDFIINIDRFLRVPYQASVIIVHHTGHSDKGRARGSMAFKGALDSEYKIVKQKEGCRMTCTKMKDFEEPMPKDFEFLTVDLPNDNSSAVLVEGDASHGFSSIDDVESLALTEDGKKALTILDELYNERRAILESKSISPSGARVLHEDWRNKVICELWASKSKEAQKKSWQRYRDKLISENLIEIEGDYVYLTGSQND